MHGAGTILDLAQPLELDTGDILSLERDNVAVVSPYGMEFTVPLREFEFVESRIASAGFSREEQVNEGYQATAAGIMSEFKGFEKLFYAKAAGGTAEKGKTRKKEDKEEDEDDKEEEVEEVGTGADRWAKARVFTRKVMGAADEDDEVENANASYTDFSLEAVCSHDDSDDDLVLKSIELNRKKKGQRKSATATGASSKGVGIEVGKKEPGAASSFYSSSSSSSSSPNSSSSSTSSSVSSCSPTSTSDIFSRLLALQKGEAYPASMRGTGREGGAGFTGRMSVHERMYEKEQKKSYEEMKGAYDDLRNNAMEEVDESPIRKVPTPKRTTRQNDLSYMVKPKESLPDFTSIKAQREKKKV